MSRRDGEGEASYPAIRFVGRLSGHVWEIAAALLPGTVVRGAAPMLKLIRPGRVTMVSLLTWVSAVVAGVEEAERWRITGAGMFFAMAGFAMDFYTDREIDRSSPRPWPINPVSTGMIGPRAARIWIGTFLVLGATLSLSVHLLTGLPAGVLIFVYWGLAAGHLDGPIGRAVTLGLLQSLYVLLAAAATGSFSPAMLWLASVFFAAMVGARAAADIRDLPADRRTGTVTLAKAFGVRPTSWILPVGVTTAALISLHVYALGVLDRDYLTWTLLSFGPGVLIAWTFPFHPTPNYAFILVWPYWGIGLLYMLALLLGSR